MGRILSIDYGLKRCGIAVSDPLRLIAGGLETVATHELKAWLKRYTATEKVDIIVVGKPTQMDGAFSDSYKAIGPFVDYLRHEYADTMITMFDERFTSVLAHRTMIEGGMKKMQRRNKAVVDKISAVIILQGYMESMDYRQSQGKI